MRGRVDPLAGAVPDPVVLPEPVVDVPEDEALPDADPLPVEPLLVAPLPDPLEPDPFDEPLDDDASTTTVPCMNG